MVGSSVGDRAVGAARAPDDQWTEYRATPAASATACTGLHQCRPEREHDLLQLAQEQAAITVDTGNPGRRVASATEHDDRDGRQQQRVALNAVGWLVMPASRVPARQYSSCAQTNASVRCRRTRRPTARAAAGFAPIASNRRPATVFLVNTATTMSAATANTAGLGIPAVVSPAMRASRRVVLRGVPPETANTAP